jgi:hypothetical protein
VSKFGTRDSGLTVPQQSTINIPIINQQSTLQSAVNNHQSAVKREPTPMSQKNGEKSRFQINRKRAVKRREKIRSLVSAAMAGAAEAKPVPVKTRRAKG